MILVNLPANLNISVYHSSKHKACTLLQIHIEDTTKVHTKGQSLAHDNKHSGNTNRVDYRLNRGKQ